MRIFLTIALLLLTLLPAQAVKRIEANPVNIAYMLCQETDSAKMNSTLMYYGYEYQAKQDGYEIYSHSNGSVIKFSFKNATEEQPFPYVEVKSDIGSKVIDSILTDLRFKKEGTSYIQKTNQYARYIISCKHEPQGFNVFHKIKIPREE